MTTKKLHAGAEVDAYCTRCKLDLAHRIIAMVGDMPKRVECMTCRSHHNYYRPRSEPQAPPKRRDASGLKAKTETERAIARAKAETERERTWEKTVSGKSPLDFKPYRPSATFDVGTLVHHPKFGDGYVVRVIDKTKVEIMFRDGARTLAQNTGQ